VTSWPADRVERRPIEGLIPYARNARTHSDAQVAQIAASMREWGWTNPVLVAEDGTVIAGHGRLLAAQRLGLREVPVMVATGWTEAQRRAYALADNKLALNAGWDESLLAIEMDDLREMDFDVKLVGFTDDELMAFKANGGGGGEGGEGEGEDEGSSSDGSLLAAVDVAIDEPRTTVERGDRWRLGQHTLMVCSVIEDWPLWSPLLTGDVLFCPFPGPFVALSDKAKEKRLVMVQPDPYVAGHIVDRFIEVCGAEHVSREGDE
jgi:hypothetical protein